MTRPPTLQFHLGIACIILALRGASAAVPARAHPTRVATVTSTPGCVAFWDFVQSEPAVGHRFTAYVPAVATNAFPLEAGNCLP